MKTGLSSARFVIGRRGRIEDADDAACGLLQYSRSELLALHGSELVPPEDRPAVAVSLEQMRQGEADTKEGRLLRKDGVPVAVLVRASRLPEERLELVIRELRDESR